MLYVGTYTDKGGPEGIYLLRMDSLTGSLRQVSAVDAGPNPSFLAIHPNGRTLRRIPRLPGDLDRGVVLPIGCRWVLTD
jgi:6-phosphogluconolactonase